MDFNAVFIDFLTSLIIVIKRLILLIFTPYKTVRKISQEDDYLQIGIIFFLIFLYFFWVDKIRQLAISPFFIFFIFIINFGLTVLFFHCLCLLLGKASSLSSFLFSFSYSLFPTLIWFVVNALTYVVLPPPRQISFLGKSFSIIFVAFSLSFLAWKLILVYLSIRFSSKMNFYQIIYSIILYLCFFLPYSVFLYKLKLFRVPFI